MRMRLLAVAVGTLLFGANAGADAPPAVAPAATPAAAPALAGRIGAPSQDVIATFASAGMREVRAHVLSDAERARVEAALAALPALHRALLDKHLHRLAFVDGIPGHGSGLTSRLAQGGYDITLRASLLDQSLGAFLTDKERHAFTPDGSGRAVVIEASGDALGYVLLHEASHVVDGALGLSTRADGPFTAGIWRDRTALAPSLAASPVATTAFRRAPALPASKAEAIYDALAHSPFVSLYASAAAPEDLAELLTWRALSRLHGATLAISVVDADGATLKRYAPLDFPGVKARMDQVDQLLRQTPM